MDLLTADLSLHVIQYLNVIDSGRLATTSQRYYYLVHQYRKLRGPELVSVASFKPASSLSSSEKKSSTTTRRTTTTAATPHQYTHNEVIQNALHGLQSQPNLVLSFTDGSVMGHGNAALARKFQGGPNKCVILGAVASSIQVNHPQGNTSTNKKDCIEHSSGFSFMAMNFPGAKIVPFQIGTSHRTSVETINNQIEQLETTLEEIQQAEQKSADMWKAMIVYCAGGARYNELFINRMQKKIPQAAIVGGICESGYVSDPNSNLIVPALDGTIIGIVLGGDAPVKSMVSRGVKSVLTDEIPRPNASSSLIVEDTAIVTSNDEGYLFQGSELPPYHLIKQIKDRDTNEILSFDQMMTRLMSISTSEFIGIKRPGCDGFELEMMSRYSQYVDAFMVMTDGSENQLQSLQNAEIDFFDLDGGACLQDMDTTVQSLKAQTQNEQILGALMFSCAGRGPEPGFLLPAKMSDATRFAKGFPNVPCLGFYAGGEIGPLALAGNSNIFQTGRVALQGFTAVFALFIVPKVDKINYHLDDSTENVQQFMKKRFTKTS